MKNETSIAISNSRCPKCAQLGMDTRGDNLAHYSDGHSFCFACGYYDNPIENRLQCINQQPDILTNKRTAVKLPGDIGIDYPDRVLDWITGYDLTREDLYTYNFLWSEDYQRLIYPVWQNESVIFWTGRYFGNDAKQSKWLNKGSPKNVVHYLNNDAKYIIIVEDVISAIKISNINRRIGSLVLFNSQNPINKLIKGKEYILWLDRDKFKESIEYAREAVSKGFNIKVRSTDNDPKEVSYKILYKELYE